jgi:phospholipase/carboxylesterase
MEVSVPSDGRMLSLLSRRGFLALGLAACSRSKEAPPKEAPLEWPRTTVHEGVTFIELFPQGADEKSPIVVAIHGRGDRPDRWVDTWRNFPGKARIALPQAPTPLGDGFSWFAFRDGMSDEQFGAEVGAAEEKLWRAIAKLAAGKRLLVTGFSQGGILSFAMASRHADVVEHAFPIGGSCPGPLLPKDKARAAPVTAFHGTDDTVLQIRWAREAVKAFAEQGNRAELREYPGVPHAIPNRMREDVWAAIVSALSSNPGSDR